MRKVIVEYKVKEEKAKQNLEYIQAVFRALDKSKPEGLRYVSFCLEDGLTFVHIASVETRDGINPLFSIDEFKSFSKDIAARCEKSPVASSVEIVGNYRFF